MLIQFGVVVKMLIKKKAIIRHLEFSTNAKRWYLMSGYCPVSEHKHQLVQDVERMGMTDGHREGWMFRPE